MRPLLGPGNHLVFGTGTGERENMIDDVQSRLRDCLSTLDDLQEENRQLRRAATAFGELAERLNQELAHERAVAKRTQHRESLERIERTNHMRPP
jgi:predicted RNase H-like nuclease (RuvC/YqgF family)